MLKSLSIKKIMLLILIGCLIVLGIVSFWPGRTSPIGDSAGNKLKGSVAKMEKIKLGGVEQWIVTRGQNINNPIILLLSGGPGGTEMGRFLKFNKKLEEKFIVVNWEQRGCGKSYPAINNKDDMVLNQYVSDINELVNYLKEKYNKEKVYLLGHSWGTIIGTMAVQKYPEQFHAYIGAAQMVNIKKTDQYIYDYVLKAAANDGDVDLVNTLKENGKPPYNGTKVLDKYKPILTKYANYYRKNNSYQEPNSEWFNPLSFLWISEYNLIDKVRVFRGVIDTFNLMYPQIQDIDFVKQATEFEVPVYYMIGKHDYTSKFIEGYYSKIKAPEKKLFWFENSHHGEIWSEADKFHKLMFEEVLES